MFEFVDRWDAGEKLAERLLDDPLIKETPRAELLVLSIPRGGVAVGAAVAEILDCAHDVIVVKKIGCPGQQEYAIGAMAEDGVIVLNQQALAQLGMERDDIDQVIERVKAQIETYIHEFRQGRALEVQSKGVIVVDDGIATGETVKAAITWLGSKDRAKRPRQVIVASPVCSMRAAKEFENLCTKLICVLMPAQFWAVSQFYWDFDQISDDEVAEILGSNIVRH
jgi:putative phosphoribosyl transferase